MFPRRCWRTVSSGDALHKPNYGPKSQIYSVGRIHRFTPQKLPNFPRTLKHPKYEKDRDKSQTHWN